MSITKERIVDQIVKETLLQGEEARSHLESLLDILKRSLAEEKDILISGFGKFSVREKTPRQGRNPKTGEPIALDGRRVVTFKLSGVLRKRMVAMGDE
jgi:integration host factor subunit alpha